MPAFQSVNGALSWICLQPYPCGPIHFGGSNGHGAGTLWGVGGVGVCAGLLGQVVVVLVSGQGPQS